MSVLNISSHPLQCGNTTARQGQSSQLNSFGLPAVVAYYPAVLKFCPNTSLGWYIEYYARSEKAQKLMRYRLRLNIVKRRYRKMSEFYEYANLLVAELNSNLRHGWTPEREQTPSAEMAIPTDMLTTPPAYSPSVPSFVHTGADETEDSRALMGTINELQKEVELLKGIVAQHEQTVPMAQVVTDDTDEDIAVEMPNTASVEVEVVPAVLPVAKPIAVAPSKDKGITVVELIDRFLKAKEGTVRKHTWRSYSSYAKLFKAYLQEFMPDIAVQDFDRQHAQAYMAYREEQMMAAKRKRGDVSDKSSRTINNHIKAHRLFFAWGLEEELITHNPFLQLKLQRNGEKRRGLVTDNALLRVREYLMEREQKGFLMVCMLIYSGFLRPKEIQELRIRDIHLDETCIIVPPEVSKNHCSRLVGLTSEIVEIMRSLHFEVLPMDYYICGKDLVPSKEKAPDASYSKAWVTMRKELNLPTSMQLYSLKDTGITTMLENGVPAIDVMKQAGHHDLSMTTRYASHRDNRLAQKMYENDMRFGVQPSESSKKDTDDECTER